MCVGVGRHIEKTVHQKNTDEVEHRLPGWMTHYSALIDTLKGKYETTSE